MKMMKKREQGNRKWSGRCLAAALILAAGLTGCGAGKLSDNAGMATEAAYEEAAGYAAETAADYESGETAQENYGLYDNATAKGAEVQSAQEDMADAGDNGVSATGTSAQTTSESRNVPVSDSKKIIKRYNYSYETEQFDKAYAYLKQQIDSFGGYVESSNINGTQYRSLNLVARIPADSSEEFTGQLGSLGTLLSQSESAEDITLQYADTESRIKSLRTEQERLNALLEKADNLDSIITLENRLTEVRYELENYQSQKNLYDDRVSYSTVNIYLEEVVYTVEVDQDSVFSRIRAGLQSTFRDLKMDAADFVVWFVVNLPYILIWIIIICIIVKVIKRIIRKRKKKKEARRKERNQESRNPALQEAQEETQNPVSKEAQEAEKTEDQKG